MDILQTSMSIIAGAGDAKSYAMEAIYLAREGKYEEARISLEKAKEALRDTHSIQTDLITKEMQGEKMELALIMVHAQDHLMGAVLIKDLAAEIVTMYEKFSK
ncbi:PTS lactose/cellobiose transporter subunit IIA [Clostridium sp. BNL1100]|uniref:PTS lactose/cellobiose transporter subunit IIA n=1 Tax=Clostridium sp. BNL1100 TaxID=755731 RepID=UPI00024A7ACA|nr:PTS lactose/cellobiose transporter subunit IIA [Clostridium sp. BNL1100]AEY67442.1 phosphotransferase system cellobiose-specific component IIA [Clostridium sp. BNL1100]